MITSVAAVLAGLVAAAYAQDMTINTPSQVRQCIPVNLAWDGGESPYYLQVLKGGSTTDQLADLGEQDSNSFSWTTNIDPGTSITLGLTDSGGSTVYSDAIDVSEGSGDDCDASGSSGGGSSGGDSSASDDDSSSSSSASGDEDDESSSAGGASTASSSAASKESSSSAEESASSAEESDASSESAASDEGDDSSASALGMSALGLVGGAVLLAL